MVFMSQQNLQLIFLFWQYFPESQSSFLDMYCLENNLNSVSVMEVLYHLLENYIDCPVS